MRERLNKILHHRAFVPASVGAVSVSFGLGAGYALGYYVSAKRHRKIWAEVMGDLDDEEETFEDPNQLKINWEEEPTPAELAARANHPSVIRRPPFEEVDDEEKDPPRVLIEHKPDRRPPTTNVFRVADEGWDQQAEEAQRSEDEPYILSKDEFFANEREDDGYFQETLIYYAGDDILTDNSDVPQYDHPRLVGEMRFGHGSGEEGVVYVRNPMLKMEYEIHRDPGTYEHEVLGSDGEEDETKVLKFREQ